MIKKGPIQISEITSVDESQASGKAIKIAF